MSVCLVGLWMSSGELDLSATEQVADKHWFNLICIKHEAHKLINIITGRDEGLCHGSSSSRVNSRVAVVVKITAE